MFIFEEDDNAYPTDDAIIASPDSPCVETINQYIGMTVDLPHEGKTWYGMGILQKWDHDAKLIGTVHGDQNSE